MSIEPEDNSADKLKDESDNNESESRRHKRYRPPGLVPRDMKGGKISFSELSCMNIDQIVEMLENKHGGLVGSAVFDPGRHYGFIVTTAEVSEMLKDGGLAVNFISQFYDFYTSAFTSPHCRKQRYQLQPDSICSCMMKIKDEALVSSLDKNRNSVLDIFRIVDGIECSTLPDDYNDSIIAPEYSYKRIPNIQRYLDNIVDTEKIPFFLKREPITLLSEEPDYSKASS